MANPDGPWVRFYASDWLAGTRGMTAAETGVYITLIALMYERDDGMIDRDDKRLSRMCGLKQHAFIAILDELIHNGKIIVFGPKLGNHKATYESQNRADRANKARNAALAKSQQKQREISANAERKQSVSSARRVLRARASEPEPDKEITTNVVSKKGSRLSDDWSPSEADAEWCRSKYPGIGKSTVETETEKFRNYWHAKTGKDATKLDWSKTWRNWIMSAMGRAGGRPPTRPTSHQGASAYELSLQLEREFENGSADSEQIRPAPPRQLSSG